MTPRPGAAPAAIAAKPLALRARAFATTAAASSPPGDQATSTPTNTDAGWVQFKPSRRGQCKSSFRARATVAGIYTLSGWGGAPLALRIATGGSKKATAVAERVSTREAADVLAQCRAPWERAAAYEVLSGFSSTAPPHLVADLADRLLEDAGEITVAERPSRWSEMALLALGSVMLQMPIAARDDALRHLRAGVRDMRMLDAAKACATGLIRATQLGLTDATTELVELFLGGRPLNDISPIWVAEVMAADLEFRARVIDAAETGNVGALSAVMCANPTEAEIGVWQELAEPLARSYLEVRAIEESEVDGVAQRSHIMASASFSVVWRPGMPPNRHALS
jgi:hypothetical protein